MYRGTYQGHDIIMLSIVNHSSFHWTNTWVLVIGLLTTTFNGIWIKIQEFSILVQENVFENDVCKVSGFCLGGLNGLIGCSVVCVASSHHLNKQKWLKFQSWLFICKQEIQRHFYIQQSYWRRPINILIFSFSISTRISGAASNCDSYKSILVLGPRLEQILQSDIN